MPLGNEQLNKNETTLDRINRIRDYVEGIIAVVGEHPECELKQEWKRDTLYLKAEFVKDIQAIANSAIPEGKDKYLIVGVVEETREIIGCSHGEFDDASIRQLIEGHLDPVPEFEVLRLKSSTGKDFVIFRFPHQPGRPFVAKTTIRDNNRAYLEEGQIWLKPGGAETGSSGKRLLKSRADLFNLIDIEPRVQKEIASRIEHILPIIRLEERTRLQGQTISSISPFASSDEEFESHVEQIIANQTASQFNVLVEKLREKTVDIWEVDLEEYGYNSRIRPDTILKIKEQDFIPAMRRVTLLGLLLIKYSVPPDWFDKIVNLLLEVFAVSHRLEKILIDINRNASVASIDEHASHTVPALESLVTAYLLAGYEISKRGQNLYSKNLLNKVVQEVRGIGETGYKDIYMFWPITMDWGYPQLGRHKLVLERYGKADRIENLLGNKQTLMQAILQVDCLIDWHSFLSFEGQGEIETVQFYRKYYPQIGTTFWPIFIFEPYTNIESLISKLWESIHTDGQHDFWLFDVGLAQAFRTLDVKRRERLIGRFLIYAQQKQAEWMLANHRAPYHIWWSTEISNAIEEARKG